MFWLKYHWNFQNADQSLPHTCRKYNDLKQGTLWGCKLHHAKYECAADLLFFHNIAKRRMLKTDFFYYPHMFDVIGYPCYNFNDVWINRLWIYGMYYWFYPIFLLGVITYPYSNFASILATCTPATDVYSYNIFHLLSFCILEVILVGELKNQIPKHECHCLIIKAINRLRKLQLSGIQFANW